MPFILLGPFSTKPLQEAGFVCLTLEFPLTNPVKIADLAQKAVGLGQMNSRVLNGVLRSPISIPKFTGLPQGLLAQDETIHQCWQHALSAALAKIPPGIYGLIFIDIIGKEEFLQGNGTFEFLKNITEGNIIIY